MGLKRRCLTYPSPSPHTSLDHARVLIEAWRCEYNEEAEEITG
jgi:hypothetical protein